MDDLDKPLREIDIWPDGEARGRLLHEIEEAQKYMIPGGKTRTWAQRLRFLVDVRNVPRAEGTSDYDFELTTDDINSTEPYLAVSYCWKPSSQKKPAWDGKILRVGVPAPTEPGNKIIRIARARPEVLLRSFSFAAAHGIRKVWIDQECIDQDDRMDKENGIQSMDLVYRYASITLVILGHHINTVKDAEKLLRLVRPDDEHFFLSFDNFDRKTDRVKEFLSMGRILTDKWFTRAWTTQEFMVSREASLVFLVGWDEQEGESEEPPEAPGKGPHECWERFFQTHSGRPVAFGSPSLDTPTGLDMEGPNQRKTDQRVPGEWTLRRDEIMNLLDNFSTLSGQAFDLVWKDGKLFMNFLTPDETMPWMDFLRFLQPIGNQFGERDWRYLREAHYTLPEVDIKKLGWLEIVPSANTPIDTGTAEATTQVTPILTSLDRQHFDTCIVRALEPLRFKACSRVTDKLAILGNLTEYRWRIDTMIIEEKKLSLSACLLALALYNGDTSLLFAFGMPTPTIRGPYDLERRKCNTVIPEWLPGQEISLRDSRQSRSNRRGKIERGSRSLVLDGTLLIEGLLWEISPFYGLQSLKEEICLFHTDPRTKVQSNYYDIGGHHLPCIQRIVQVLFALGRRDIVELIPVICRENKFFSPAETLLVMNELEDWFHGKRDWPIGIDDLFDPEAIGWICCAIILDKPLAIGHCDIGGRKLLSIFNYDADEEAMIFTPLNHLTNEFMWKTTEQKLKRVLQLSWCVKICEREVGEKKMMMAKEALEKMSDVKVTVADNQGENAGEGPYVMNMCLKIIHPTHVEGFWSERLSSSGLLMPVPESKSWRMVPLGKASAYYFFC